MRKAEEDANRETDRLLDSGRHCERQVEGQTEREEGGG